MHFHTFSYTGRGFSDPQVRSGRASTGYPPIEIKDTPLSGPRLDSIDDVLAWLKSGLTKHDPLDSKAFPVETRLEYSRARLRQTAAGEVVYAYWSTADQFVAFRVIPCRACAA